VNKGTDELYRAKQFATLAGVTVRALHHYDRMGLLRPKQRSQAGYRLYTARDFARLEQIVVLKFLGIPLKQIRRLLEPDANLSVVLQRQMDVLFGRRLQLDRAIRAIRNARKACESKREPDWKLFQFIVQEIEMQNTIEWKRKYFSAEAQALVAARRLQISPEQQEKSNKDWLELTTEIQRYLHEDPAGPKAQALASRWQELLDEFTGGDSEILKGFKAMWADYANWPSEVRKASPATDEVRRFIDKALAANRRATVTTYK
jgi:MerR family transcriptional regulator, thiopeptide resistance regulator